MENTEKLLFGEDLAEWFLALGDRSVGPVKASEIHERVQAREITIAHYVWKEGMAEWKRICDVPLFQASLPSPPKSKPAPPIPKDAPGVSSSASPPPGPRSAPVNPLTQAREWFLYYNDSQFGPFSEEEITRFIESGKIHSKVHIWKEGQKNWERLESIQLFAPLLEDSKNKTPKSPKSAKQAAASILDNKDVKLEQRRGSRTPLVAKVVLAGATKGKEQPKLAVGICRDISVGGMQVLTDQVPGPVGTTVKLNVSPSEYEKSKRIEPFVADGVIVRILEDGRGFSFRFEKLSAQARESIEAYIEST